MSQLDYLRIRRSVVVALLGLSIVSGADTSVGRVFATTSEQAPLQPNFDLKILTVQPPAQWNKFVIPVSVHIACRDQNTCVAPPGALYTPAYLGRMVATSSKHFSPPLDGVFRDEYRGIQFVLVSVDKVISEKLYNWKDKEDHDAIVRQLVDEGNQSIVGYYNYFITGRPLCGVSGINQLMKDAPRSFIGPDCFSDDDQANGFFGAGVIAHETMHAIGMGHITTGTKLQHPGAIETMDVPECGLRFRYLQHLDADYATLDQAGVCHPERNHFMGRNTRGEGQKGARCGFASMFTSGSYGKVASDQELATRDGKMFLPARYGYVSEALIACWAYRNSVLHPVPQKVASVPLIEFASPSQAGTLLAGKVTVAVSGFDWNGHGIRELTLGVDTPAGEGAPMHVTSHRDIEHKQQSVFELSIDTTKYPSGHHDLAVRAVNEAGVQTWLSHPVWIVNPPAAHCVRFEGCVDGSDSITLKDHNLSVEHVGGEAMGHHADCSTMNGLQGRSLGSAQTGGFLLSGQPHGIQDVSQGRKLKSSIKDLGHVYKVDGRGKVVLKGYTVTLDDSDAGASRYVVDMCE